MVMPFLDRGIVHGDTIGIFSRRPHNKWDVAASLVRMQCWLLAHCFFMDVVKVPLATLTLNIKFITCTAVDELVGLEYSKGVRSVLLLFSSGVLDLVFEHFDVVAHGRRPHISRVPLPV